MPIATSNITRPEEAVEVFVERFEDQSAPLGLEFIGAYDERLIPAFPAVVISAGPLQKEVHGTHTYLYTLRVFFYVMHAKLTTTHRIRNKEDLELATRLVDFIEEDKTLSGKILFGHVEAEIPGALSPRAAQGLGSAVVGTRLNWMGISEGRFK